MTSNRADTSTAGSQDDALQARLTALNAHPAEVRYVDYQHAEEACERLAARILEVFPREELRHMSFVPVPRGGMIVLGILSYFLGLDHSQLSRHGPGSGPVVVIDDVVLTGFRFAQMLPTLSADRVIFAHLFSHPDLRTAIEEAEPRVERCVAAHDLSDQSAAAYPDPEQRREWRRWWLDRLGPQRYWFGQPELVAFPWNEPDLPLWNPARSEVEGGWHFIPPHRCLGNRAGLGLPPRSLGDRRWIIADGVVYGLFEDGVYLVRRPTGEVFGFKGVAGDMWRALAGYGSVEAAVEHLLERYEAEPARLRADTEAFLHDLIASGLMTACPDENTTAQ